MDVLKQSFATAFLGILGGTLLFKFPHAGESFATIFLSAYLVKTLKPIIAPTPSSGTTPYNPLKIPAKNITPVKP